MNIREYNSRIEKLQNRDEILIEKIRRTTCHVVTNLVTQEKDYFYGITWEGINYMLTYLEIKGTEVVVN
jgi:hypothetical protein